MGMCVCGGALISCSFGMAPMPLNVLPKNKVVTSMPIANVADNVPFLNIPPFVMCKSMSNPAVAAATAAALGALTPMPCTPVVTAPWSPGSPTVQIGGQAALTDSSQAICAFGGAIQINMPGQFTIMVP